MAEPEQQAPAAAKSKPRGAASVTPPKRSALLTWMGRLLTVAICVVGVLAWGFYQAPGPGGQPQRKLPWDDPQGFQAYAQDTFVWARNEGEKAAVKAKQKLDEIQWSKEADDLWSKADAFLGGSSGASAGASAATGPQPGTGTAVAANAGASSSASSSSAAKSSTASSTSSGATKPPGAAEGDPAIGPGSTPKAGYYEAYKAGYKSYRDGLVHFRNAKASKSRGKELKSALDEFQKASTSWQAAIELRERDPNLDELMRDLNQYIYECRKQLKATSY